MGNPWRPLTSPLDPGGIPPPIPPVGGLPPPETPAFARVWEAAAPDRGSGAREPPKVKWGVWEPAAPKDHLLLPMCWPLYRQVFIIRPCVLYADTPNPGQKRHYVGEDNLRSL